MLFLPGEFPYAKCFICGETGHLSRTCPDNPKGLYAQGIRMLTNIFTVEDTEILNILGCGYSLESY